jgi:chromosome segregation ATPase
MSNTTATHDASTHPKTIIEGRQDDLIAGLDRLIAHLRKDDLPANAKVLTLARDRLVAQQDQIRHLTEQLACAERRIADLCDAHEEQHIRADAAEEALRHLTDLHEKTDQGIGLGSAVPADLSLPTDPKA